MEPTGRANARPMTGSAQSGSVFPLTEIGRIGATIATPIRGQNTRTDIAVQRGKWPIGWRRYQPVLDRIEMNIVGAALEIPVISYGVFPKALLPNGIFAAMIA